MSFIKVNIKMTTQLKILLSHDYSAGTDPPLDMFSTSFLRVASRLIID